MDSMNATSHRKGTSVDAIGRCVVPVAEISVAT